MRLTDDRRLIAGKATCVRQYPVAIYQDIAGDFIVWKQVPSVIHWQRLDFQDDGSLHAHQKLPFYVTWDEMENLRVNEEGYMYVDRTTSRARSRVEYR